MPLFLEFGGSLAVVCENGGAVVSISECALSSHDEMSGRLA